MQQAPVSEVRAATELNCQFCGWPLIKNGELVCHRSGHTVKATLGQERIFCPYCRKPKVTLAKDDRAICPKCKEGKREGTLMTIASQEVRSKTKELQEWLDREIERLEKDIVLLQTAINLYDLTGGVGVRYEGLTSEEIEVKVPQDRKELEEVKKRLGALQAARELKVNVDALETVFGVEIEITYRKYFAPTLKWLKPISDAPGAPVVVRKKVELDLAERRLCVTTEVFHNFDACFQEVSNDYFQEITEIHFLGLSLLKSHDVEFVFRNGGKVFLCRDGTSEVRFLH